jgi:cephalosporin hydroxylase
LCIDDIVFGYERLFEKRSMYSMVSFLGVAMQQDPNDALVIADLLWRVRPRLLIELGTAGGGSALWYARAMLGYDPEARVLTVDPGRAGSSPHDWNHATISSNCPHCTPAKDSPIFAKAVEYINALPTSKDVLARATKLAREVADAGLPVLVIEDSDHKYQHVRLNLQAYAPLVTNGSYLIAQDTRTGRGPFREVVQAVDEFMQVAPEFVRDRRPEYLLFTQHSGGFLRKLENSDVKRAVVTRKVRPKG